jgi:metal-dependent amidase/aminoacylase/carboxypeptidase family protein
LFISMPVFHAGSAHNVIPNVAELEGTFRTLKAETRDFARRRILEVATGIGETFGCKIDVEFEKNGYPVTMNEPGAAARFRKVMSALDGVELMPDCVPVMGGEDFAFYGQSGVPACFYWLGLRPSGAETYPNVHTPLFDFSDDAIPVGVSAMTALALGALHS